MTTGEKTDLDALIERVRGAIEPLAAMDAKTSKEGERDAFAFDAWAADRIVFNIGKDRKITVADLREARAVRAILTAIKAQEGRRG